jgi:hypothetical protein
MPLGASAEIPEGGAAQVEGEVEAVSGLRKGLREARGVSLWEVYGGQSQCNSVGTASAERDGGVSIHRRNPRRDANERALVAGWRAIGAEVWLLSGKGLPDALVRFRGVLHGFEIKTAKGRLTEHQGDFPVIRTMDEGLRALGVIR